jgi:thymidylate kinase
MHIAIEGIDGVGKSTAAENLAKALNFKLVEKPLHYLFDEDGSDKNYLRIRDQVNKNPNKCFTGWFYGLGNIYLYERFKDENIITDRHILSNYCWSGSEESEYIFDAIYRTIGSPDYTFLIYASPEAVEKRLRNRDIDDPDLRKVEEIPSAYKRMKYILNKYKMPGLVIDTSDIPEKDVVDIMINELKRVGLLDG